ncbi:hypothetical protein [Streptacidiphilus sp. MAP5-3]|uniref:hypothetical protein n=1 Tax=unclassified Streptacidiphilus TaxID=2643834 RepID=UPI003515B88F
MDDEAAGRAAGRGGVILPRQRTDGPGPGFRVPALRMELLVHGVGGTTPETMLDDPHLKQVTGDTVSGTYRRWQDQDAERRPADYRGGAVLEAYSWARLTSGAASRAFWLLLLPFMFVNLAHWMRPAEPEQAGGAVGGTGTGTADGADSGTADGAVGSRDRVLYEALVRVIAGSLTVLLTAAACEIALDLLAWQCAADGRCVAQHSWLVFALGGHGGWWGMPGRRLVVAALVPLAMLGVLGRLSRMTWSSYEAVRPMEAERGNGPEPIEMERDGFWFGEAAVGRLRVLHLAAGLLTVAWAVLVPVLAHDLHAGSAGGSTQSGGVPAWIGYVLLAALVGLGAVLLVALAAGAGHETLSPRTQLRASLAALAAVYLYAAWSRPGWVPTGELPGVQRGLAALVAAQVALVLALGVVAWQMTHRQPSPSPVDPDLTVPAPDGSTVPDSGFGGPNGAALHNLTGPVTAMLGCGVGGLFTAGAALFTGQRLGSDLQAAPLLVWAASGATLLVPVLLVVGARLARRLMRTAESLRPQVLAAYDEPGTTTDSVRTGQIAKALSGARLTESAAGLVAAFAGLAGLLSLAALVGSLTVGRSPEAVTAKDGMVLSHLTTVLQNLGGWLTTVLVLGLLVLGLKAYDSLTTRRSVGIIWDIGTFWPRAAHPLAPPCYAERAVPDIEARIRAWLKPDPGRRLVLSAHSQGTVLAAAALWQLDPDTRSRIALLTYGSPLRRLYGRFFPAYMGPTMLARLERDVPRWDNLFRLTDPIGGPVRVPTQAPETSPDLPPFPDPVSFGRSEDHPILVPIRAHFDYRVDPRFIAARDELLRALTH